MSQADLDNFDPDFDALLDQARWPEPPAQAVTRLSEQWRELSNPRPRMTLRLGWLAAAAVFVLAIGATWLLTQGEQVSPTQVVVTPPPQPTRHQVSPPSHPSPPPGPRIVSRQATPRETLVVLAATPAVDIKAAVRKALDSAEVDGDAEAIGALRALRARAVERELAVAFATTKEVPRRRSALRMLSELGTPSSLPLLSRAAADPKFTEVAMPGVARLGGSGTVLALTRAAQSDVRREAISALLKFDDDRAVSEFLAIVLDDARRGDALAALHGSHAPPVERFIANLEHPQVDRRFAAAKALGSMCDRTDVGLTLRRMVDQNDRRREALAALLSCPNPKAATFINAARARTSSIDAEVRAVQTELQRIF